MADPPNPSFESTSKDNDKTFQKTNAETILGQSSSVTTLEYNYGLRWLTCAGLAELAEEEVDGDGVSEELDFVCIVLPIGIAYWPLLFPCGRTGTCYSLVEEQGLSDLAFFRKYKVEASRRHC